MKKPKRNKEMKKRKAREWYSMIQEVARIIWELDSRCESSYEKMALAFCLIGSAEGIEHRVREAVREVLRTKRRGDGE